MYGTNANTRYFVCVCALAAVASLNYAAIISL